MHATLDTTRQDLGACAGGQHTQMLDLLLVGMEASLWTAEQFASDVKVVCLDSLHTSP